jgi:hypothetical protein
MDTALQNIVIDLIQSRNVAARVVEQVPQFIPDTIYLVTWENLKFSEKKAEVKIKSSNIF